VRAQHALAANRDKLESLTMQLLEHETLDEDDAYRAAGFHRDPVDVAAVMAPTQLEAGAPTPGSTDGDA